MTYNDSTPASSWRYSRWRCRLSRSWRPRLSSVRSSPPAAPRAPACCRRCRRSTSCCPCRTAPPCISTHLPLHRQCCTNNDASPLPRHFRLQHRLMLVLRCVAAARCPASKPVRQGASRAHLRGRCRFALVLTRLSPLSGRETETRSHANPAGWGRRKAVSFVRAPTWRRGRTWPFVSHFAPHRVGSRPRPLTAAETRFKSDLPVPPGRAGRASSGSDGFRLPRRGLPLGICVSRATAGGLAASPTRIYGSTSSAPICFRADAPPLGRGPLPCLPARAVFIDHSSRHAILALTNRPDGERWVRESMASGWGSSLCHARFSAWPCGRRRSTTPSRPLPGSSPETRPLHWGETARESYERHVELVDAAERWLAAAGGSRRIWTIARPGRPSGRDRAWPRRGPLLRGRLPQPSGDPDQPSGG